MSDEQEESQDTSNGVDGYLKARGTESPASIKCLPTEFKFDSEKGTLEGYASLFDVMDSYGDFMQPGAFKASIEKNKAFKPSRIKNLWQHNPANPIGLPEILEEDSTGLYMRSKMGKTRQIMEYMELLADGIVDGLSIGYFLEAAEEFYDDELSSQLKGWFKNGPLYRILRVDLREISLVTFPAVEGARAVAKNDQGVWGEYHRNTQPGWVTPPARKNIQIQGTSSVSPDQIAKAIESTTKPVVRDYSWLKESNVKMQDILRDIRG